MINAIGMVWAATGIVAAAFYLAFCRRAWLVDERTWLATGLLIAALIYVVFGWLNGGADWQGIQWGGLLLYGAFAMLGWKRDVRWLIAGWGLHALWDVALHLHGPGAHLVPAGYAWLCAGFNVAVAATLAQRWRMGLPNQATH